MLIRSIRERIWNSYLAGPNNAEFIGNNFQLYEPNNSRCEIKGCSSTEPVQDASFSNFLEGSSFATSASTEPATVLLEEGWERNDTFKKALASTEVAGSQLVCTWPGCHMEKFSRPCELKKHQDEHTKPYICLESACNGLGFGDKARLQRHAREKHQIATFRCPVATYHRHRRPFARKYNLNSHIKNRHQDRLNSQDLESATRDSGYSTSSMNNIEPRIDPPLEQQGRSTSANLEISTLNTKLQEREAERRELASVQAHVEKEIEALKMALDILNK